MPRLVEMVRCSYELAKIAPFTPKNAPGGKGGYRDLPGLRQCPHESAIRGFAKIIGVTFSDSESKKCFCGHLTLESGETVPFAVCMALRNNLRDRQEKKKDQLQRLGILSFDINEGPGQAEEPEEDSLEERLREYWSFSEEERDKFLADLGMVKVRSKTAEPKLEQRAGTSKERIRYRVREEQLKNFERLIGDGDTLESLKCPLAYRLALS